MEDKPKEKKSKSMLDLLDEKGMEGISEEELDACIRGLYQGGGVMPGMEHGRIILGLCLSSERQRRFIKELENDNKKTQFWFKLLAIGSLLIGLSGFLWQVGLDTHSICRFVLPAHMTSKCVAPLEIQDTQALPQSSLPIAGTNPEPVE